MKILPVSLFPQSFEFLCCSPFRNFTQLNSDTEDGQHYQAHQPLFSRFPCMCLHSDCIDWALMYSFCWLGSKWEVQTDARDLKANRQNSYEQHNHSSKAWLTKLAKRIQENVHYYLNCHTRAIVIDKICMRYDAISEYCILNRKK